MRIASTLAGIIATVVLAALYIALGYLVCAKVPITSETILGLTVDGSGDAFTRTELIDGALAVRDYSFGDHDAGALADAILHMNAEAMTPYADGPPEGGLIDERYALAGDAIAHLDDVWEVASGADRMIVVLAVLLIVLIVIGAVRGGLRLVGGVLMAAGIIDLIGIALLLLWALLSFDGLFSTFHGLFFAEGTWLFAADSLLIRMLPEGFWMGMGAVWLSTSALASVLSIICGRALARLGGR